MVLRFISACLLLVNALFSMESFTVASFNCGGLPDHYDYLHASCMHKLMQIRYQEEGKKLAELDKIQNLALRVLFSEGSKEQDYDEKLKALTQESQQWQEKARAMISGFQELPVQVFDGDVLELVGDQVEERRQEIARRIFRHELKYDIIALQEAQYIHEDLLPSDYETLLGKIGLLWRKERFCLERILGDAGGRGLVVELRCRDSGELLVVASGHLRGCNPFQEESGDAKAGDQNLRDLLALLEQSRAEIKVIAMDSNVTATHPRLKILKGAGYSLDDQNYLEPTCTNPIYYLNTRIDWIATKNAQVENIPVLGVGLNCPWSNQSDHKPIAARIIAK